jgi:hypothetical protein
MKITVEQAVEFLGGDIDQKPHWVEVGDEKIVRHYLGQGSVLSATYNRRTTVTTYEKLPLPRSLS